MKTCVFYISKDNKVRLNRSRTFIFCYAFTQQMLLSIKRIFYKYFLFKTIFINETNENFSKNVFLYSLSIVSRYFDEGLLSINLIEHIINELESPRIKSFFFLPSIIKTSIHHGI